MLLIVSIHAPAWGATAKLKRSAIDTLVSIHAPAWGATLEDYFANALTGVSIHAPAWGATQATKPCLSRIFVSIHAPAWGATPEISISKAIKPKFQSTHPHGVRQRSACEMCYNILFQSTHPHGVRRGPIAAILTSSRFNPRTRMGCD